MGNICFAAEVVLATLLCLFFPVHFLVMPRPFRVGTRIQIIQFVEQMQM